MTIAEQIYNGKTATDIGIDNIEFASRKATLDDFLSGWSGEDFNSDYLEWIKSRNSAPLIGDRIASMTKAVGIQPCGGCKKRKEWLNEKHKQLRELMKPKVEEV